MQTRQNETGFAETGFAVEAGGEVSLVVGDGRRLPLHPVWLRERSRDAEMFDARTSQRLFDPAALPDDLEIEAAAVEADGALAVRFSDGHAARIAARDLVWDAAAREPGRPRPILWDAKTVAAPYFERDRLIQSARARDEAADAFARLGFFIASGVPCVEGEIERFANLFGPVRATNFGKIFDVRVDSEGNDLAYTGLALTGHTDNPYRRATPEVQLLHALINEAAGGESTLADGFRIAEIIRAEHPEEFRVLTEIETVFRFVDRDIEIASRRPIVQLDAKGDFAAVRYSTRLDYAPPLPPTELAIYYRARRRFGTLAESPRCRFDFRLRAGDLLVMDNTRLLHGRSAYAESASGRRHLQGCYMDSDSFFGLLQRSYRREIENGAAA